MHVICQRSVAGNRLVSATQGQGLRPVFGGLGCSRNLRADFQKQNHTRREKKAAAIFVRAEAGKALSVLASSSVGGKTVAVAGATGLIGSRLVEMLVQQGYSVRVLTRNPAAAKSKLNIEGLQYASPTQWKAAIAGSTAVINLAGEPIATRWSAELKAEIKRSRVQVTKRVVDAINSLRTLDRG